MSFFELSGLSAGYGARVVLEDFNLSLPAQGLTLLIGPNGSGKSTFFRALFDLADARATRFEFLGREVSVGSRSEWLRSQCAYVPQYANVFRTISVDDNLGLAVGKHWRKECPEALALLVPDISRRGNERADRLSGGQRQLLALAMGLHPSRRLLLLDEPLAGLDPEAATRVVAAIVSVARSRAVVVVEHRYSLLAPAADKLVALRAGKTVLRLADVSAIPSPTLMAQTYQAIRG